MRQALLSAGAGLVALTLLAPSSAALELGEADGRPIRLDITESLLTNWHATLDDQVAGEHDNVFNLINRLNLRLSWDKLAVGLRIDAAWFPNPPTDEYQDDIRPEELYIKYRLGKLQLTLGDDYVSFGRGLALTLRKFDELGYDLNLRGVHALYKHKVFKAQLTAGITNVVNVDAVESKLIDDPNDVVFGLRLEGRPLKWLRVGAHVVDVERRNSGVYQDLSVIIPGDNTEDVPVNNQYAIRSLVYGGNLELTNVGKLFDLYLEVDGVRTESERNTARGREVNDPEHGLAFYGAWTGYLGDLNLLLEGKHYEEYRLGPTAPVEAGQALTYEGLTYIAPPTLERIDQRVVDNQNVNGVHLRADYALPDTGERFFLSGAYFWDIGLANDGTTLHTYAGWEHRADNATDRLQLQAGYRQEDDGIADQTILQMVHIDFDLFWVITGPHDIQFHWSHEFRTKKPLTGEDDSYLEGTSYVSWNFAPHWSFSLQFEYLTDKQTEDPIFPGGSVVYRIDDSSHIRLFGGRQKGGLKCSGGVCRIFPEFEGVQLETTLRF